jgi:hypothetical protein
MLSLAFLCLFYIRISFLLPSTQPAEYVGQCLISLVPRRVRLYTTMQDPARSFFPPIIQGRRWRRRSRSSIRGIGCTILIDGSAIRDKLLWRALSACVLRLPGLGNGDSSPRGSVPNCETARKVLTANYPSPTATITGATVFLA